MLPAPVAARCVKREAVDGSAADSVTRGLAEENGAPTKHARWDLFVEVDNIALCSRRQSGRGPRRGRRHNVELSVASVNVRVSWTMRQWNEMGAASTASADKSTNGADPCGLCLVRQRCRTTEAQCWRGESTGDSFWPGRDLFESGVVAGFRKVWKNAHAPC